MAILKTLRETALRWAAFGISATLCMAGVAFALTYNWTDPSALRGKTAGNPLQSSQWNLLVGNVDNLNERLANAEAAVASLSASTPAWAVMAFNLASCPAGWSAFASANGRAVIWVWNDGQGNAYSLLNSWGEAKHTLTVAEMPSHTHGFSIGTTDDNNSPWNVALLQLGDNGPFSYANFTTAATGWGGSHENRMPYVALLYCVKN